MLSIPAIVLSLFSCIGQQEPAYLEVSKADFHLPTINDTTLVVMLYYSNDWQAEFLDPSWCRVTPSSGKGRGGKVLDSVSLNIKVDKNITNQVRQNILRITSVNLVLEPIIQQAK